MHHSAEIDLYDLYVSDPAGVLYPWHTVIHESLAQFSAYNCQDSRSAARCLSRHVGVLYILSVFRPIDLSHNKRIPSSHCNGVDCYSSKWVLCFVLNFTDCWLSQLLQLWICRCLPPNNSFSPRWSGQSRGQIPQARRCPIPAKFVDSFSGKSRYTDCWYL